MRSNATVDQVLRSVALDVCVDRSVLARLLRRRPEPAAVLALLSSPEIETQRAAVLYLGVYGSARECPLLALCLRDDDLGIAQLAEYGLWSIWMQSGTGEGNRQLAAAIGCIKNQEYATAIQILSVLVRQESEFAEAYFQLGIAFCFVDRPDEAAQVYRQALRLNQYHFGAAAALGHTCVEQGNMAGALHYYRHALQIHPHLDDLPEAVRELECLVERCSPGPGWS